MATSSGDIVLVRVRARVPDERTADTWARLARRDRALHGRTSACARLGPRVRGCSGQQQSLNCRSLVGSTTVCASSAHFGALVFAHNACIRRIRKVRRWDGAPYPSRHWTNSSCHGADWAVVHGDAGPPQGQRCIDVSSTSSCIRGTVSTSRRGSWGLH